MLYKPPSTPPFLLILFAVVHIFAALLDFGFGLVRRNSSASAALLDIVRVALATVYTWLAGTMPLQPILPAQNVAGPKDVRFLVGIASFLLTQWFLDPFCNPFLS